MARPGTAVAVSFVVLISVATVLNVQAFRHLAAKSTELDTAREEARTTTDQLAAAHSAVDELASLRDDSREQAGHVAETAAQLGALHDTMQAVRADIAAASDRVAQVEDDARTLASCLATLSAARIELEADDAEGARSALTTGSETCQRAAAIADRSGVYPYDFADPFVLVVGDRYFAYGTNGAGGQVQVLSSGDETNWQLVGDAMPTLPTWAQSGHTWSPTVMATSGVYVLYYTARERASGRQCIGAGVSTQPQGPFLDLSSVPLICQTSLGGSIDASPYRAADGTPYLTWKSEGETVGGKSEIWARQLAPDGGSLVGEAAVLLRADRSWEAGVIEGPSMTLTGDGWTLLYSGNAWTGAAYAVGFATCAGPLGPCTKPAHNEVLGSNARYGGPGGPEWFVDAGGALSVSFAAWDADEVGFPSPRRLHLTQVISISRSRVVLDP